MLPESPLLFSSVNAITIRLLPSHDLKATLDAFAKEMHVQAACIITCVGSLQKVGIRYANLAQTTILEGKFEIVSLTGTLSEIGCHLHICVSDSTGKTTGGHLTNGSVIYTTAEIVIGILPEVVYKREVDETYGYRELVIEAHQPETKNK